jgi:cytochrome c553
MFRQGLAPLVAWAALSAAAIPAALAGDYSDLRRIHAVQGDANAGKRKAQVCAGCHGEAGISLAPIFPNLAGQSAEYLYWQLVEYKRGKRAPSPMTPLAQPLSDADMRDLASYFASIKSASSASEARGALPSDSAPVGEGMHLFLDGNAAKGVPPCQGCHGPDARGNPLARQLGPTNAYYRTYPALRGQKQQYLVTRLTDYREGRLTDSSNNFIMQAVARGLDDGSIQSLAAWLSSLPPPNSP